MRGAEAPYLRLFSSGPLALFGLVPTCQVGGTSGVVSVSESGSNQPSSPVERPDGGFFMAGPPALPPASSVDGEAGADDSERPVDPDTQRTVAIPLPPPPPPPAPQAHRPGDVVNGYVLTSTQEWVPVGRVDPVATPTPTSLTPTAYRTPVIPAVYQQPRPVAAYPTYPAYRPAVALKRKSVLVAFLLAFFFGGFSLFYVSGTSGAVSVLVILLIVLCAWPLAILVWPVTLIVTPLLAAQQNKRIAAAEARGVIVV